MGSCVSAPAATSSDVELFFGPTDASAMLVLHLPDDVLYSVFTFVAQAEPVHSIHDSPRSSIHEDLSHYSRLGWTRLSGVCRRWRAVLISLTPLWATIVFHLPPEPALLALLRAGGYPLNVRVPGTLMGSPPRESRIATLRRKLARVKGLDDWQQPYTHRERLLTLAITHTSRMKELYVENMTARDFRGVFENSSFHYLRVLVLKHSLIFDERQYETLGNLHIIAPRVEQAHLGAMLPMTHDDGPGLRFSLPALRDLELPCYFSRIRCIPLLVRGALRLRSLVVDVPTFLQVDWQKVFGEKPVHLGALCAIRLSGSCIANLDQLFSQISTTVPPHTSFTITDYMHQLDGSKLQLMASFAEIISQSLRAHPLDSMVISRGAHSPSESFNLVAFSEEEIPGPYLMGANLLYNACRRSRYAAALSVPSISMHSELAGDMLDVLAPLLTQNAIKHLVLDEHVTDNWAQTLRSFLQSCLPDVTTLHCTYVWNPIAYGNQPATSPSAMVLRLFKQHAEPDHTLFYPPEPDIDIAPSAPPMLRPFDNESPSAAEILRSSHCLPALETLVVSMCVPLPKKGKKRRSPGLQPTLDAVDAWWDDLVQALSYRCDIGLRIRMLRMVGGWASDELYYATAGKDAKMFAQAAGFVDEILDERIVGLMFTYDRTQDVTETFSSERAFPMSANGAW